MFFTDSSSSGSHAYSELLVLLSRVSAQHEVNTAIVLCARQGGRAHIMGLLTLKFSFRSLLPFCLAGVASFNEDDEDDARYSMNYCLEQYSSPSAASDAPVRSPWAATFCDPFSELHASSVAFAMGEQRQHLQ